MTQRELNIWDYLFYFSLLVLTLWLMLKSLGIIQTPFWLEYGVPMLSLIITLLTFYQNILDKISKLSVSLAMLNTKSDHLEKDVEFLKRKII